MLLTRFDPLLWNSLNRMNQFFRPFADEGTTWPALGYAHPPVNLWEDDNNVYAEVELPGMKEDQLEIFVTEGNVLTIQGERQPAEARGVWHRRERGFGKFSRTVELPVPVDADRVEARFEAGVLRVTLPKAEAARPKRIPVKGA